MRMIIDISEDAYKAVCNGCMLPPDVENVVNSIKNGTPIQQPFINKPCISEGVCHEDKMQTLDKIRAEIENHCGYAKEYHCECCYSCPNLMGVKEILEVVDKYRSESEVNADGNR